MMEDVILRTNIFVCSLNHCKMQNCSYVFFPIFNKNTAEIPNYMGMGHVPKFLKKIPVLSNNSTCSTNTYFI